MIVEQYERFILVCDMCGEDIYTEELTFDTFEDVVSFMKKEGWETVNYNGTWENYCPECSRNADR